MVESGEVRGFHGGYVVDGGRIGWKIEDIGPVALKFVNVLKSYKITKIINKEVVDPCHEIFLSFFVFYFSF